MNSQISSVTGVSPSELFQGRLPWRFECSMEPSENPQVESWVLEQLFLQEKACLRVKHLRSVAMERKNKWRSPASYAVGEWVLIHKSRWPQRKVDKVDSPWFGPFQVVQVGYNSLSVLASPSLGGLVKVSFSQLKRWSSVHDPHWFDSSPCSGENGESEDGPVSGQFTESSSPPRPTSEEERGGEGQQSAGDEQEHERESKEDGPEQDARQAEGPRTRSRARREGRSARDEETKTEKENSTVVGIGVVPVVGDPHNGIGSMEERGAVPGEGDQEVQVVVPVGDNKKMEFTVEEAQERGFFNVEKIMAHKFKFGHWRFLVKWEGFPMSSASWEPVKCFQLPGGRINSIFARYVQKNGMQEVLGRSGGR